MAMGCGCGYNGRLSWLLVMGCCCGCGFYSFFLHCAMVTRVVVVAVAGCYSCCLSILLFKGFYCLGFSISMPKILSIYSLTSFSTNRINKY